MSVGLQLAIAFGSVAALLGLMAVVRRLAQAGGLSAEVQRKLVHVGTGLYALSLPWLFPDRWPVYMLIAVTLVAMAVLRVPALSRGLGETLHGVERRSYGDFLLAISVGLCFFLSDGNALLYVLPIAVLTMADAAAALAGTTYGTKLFRVEDSHKSVEGTVVFFVITLLIAIICLMLLSDLPAPNILALAAMVAAFGTLVEAQSWRGFDNLFLPLGLLVFLAVHSQSSLGELAALAALFLAAILGFRRIGRRVGLTTHAAHVYVVAMFLVLAVVEVQNAILPALVLVTHAWASLRNPCGDPHADLDIVASLALFSFGWLALGNATGWNAVGFYGLSAMGLAMGFAVIALRGNLPGLLVVGAVLFGLRTGTVEFNPPDTTWAEPLWGLALLCLAVPAVAAVAAPGFFNRDRVLKLTVLALLLPVGYYLAAVFGPDWLMPFDGGTS